MESPDDRVSHNPNVRKSGQSVGEAGLHHLAASINGYTVNSEAAAVSILAEFAYMTGIEPVTGVEFARKRGRKRGIYSPGARSITHYGVPHLSTLVHEWAHHMVFSRPQLGPRGRRPQFHGPQFKRALQKSYQLLEQVTGIAVKRMSTDKRISTAKAETFKVGDKVKVKGLVGVATIVKRNRVRYRVTAANGAQYNAHPGGMTLAEEAA